MNFLGKFYFNKNEKIKFSSNHRLQIQTKFSSHSGNVHSGQDSISWIKYSIWIIVRCMWYFFLSISLASLKTLWVSVFFSFCFQILTKVESNFFESKTNLPMTRWTASTKLSVVKLQICKSWIYLTFCMDDKSFTIEL